MTAAVVVKQYADVHTNLTTTKKLQRDKIVDPGTIGMFDFSYKWGYEAQASPVVGSAQFRNFVRGGASAVNGPLAKTWTGNMIVFPAGNATAKIDLPASWKMPAGATHFSIGLIGKIATSGYPTGAAGTQNAEIIGCRGGGNTQYSFYIQYDKTTGTMTKTYLGFNLQLFDVTAYMPTDGAKHEFGLEFEVITTDTWVARFWVDGVLKYTSPPQAWGGSLNQASTATPAIGAYYQASTYEAAAFSIGRVWLEDHTVTGAKTMAAMIAADYASRASRFA